MSERFREIAAGSTYRHRFLLEGDFDLNSPGTYHITAKRDQRVTGSGATELNVDLKVDSEFDVLLRTPIQQDLQKVYQLFFDDLRSRDLTVRSFAARAITQNPPSFAEPFILTLADDPVLNSVSVDGLMRLTTAAARSKLLQMSSPASPEWLRQQAIPALGQIANADDCEAMLRIADQNTRYTQIQAYVAAGEICGERSVRLLNSLTLTADPPLLGGLALALKNTASASAIPILINLLKNSDENVRRDAEDALGLLTHRKSRYGLEDLNSSLRSYNEWSAWWMKNAKAAVLYNPNECVAPQFLTP